MSSLYGRSINNLSFSHILVIFSLFFGAFVRLYAPAQTDFPILDGGLFYTMTQDLINNNFILPVYTSFNHANIPYAYPPIAFYITAFLNRFLQLDLIDLIHWMPALLAIAAIPAFYFLSCLILKDDFLAALSTLAFALLPATFDLYIMGGGLTRSWGMVFSLLTLASAIKLYTHRSFKQVLNTAIFASLLILGHPEATFHTFFLVGLLWLFYGRDRESAVLSFSSAILILLFTSPWWVIILQRHGLAPFLASLQSGWHNLFFWTPWIRMDFAGERFVDLITVLGMFGFVIHISQKKYFLPAWLLLPFIVEPRNPSLFACLALCMLAAVSFRQLAIALAKLEKKLSAETLSDIETLSSRSGKWLLAIFFLYPLISAFSTSLQLSSYHLTQEQWQAIQWIQDNTPADSRFVILAFQGTFTIPFQEWLPSLSRRVNLAVEVGYEWMPNRAFEKRRAALIELNRCIFTTIECVESWAMAQNIQLEYVLVYQGLITPVDYKLGNELIRSMEDSSQYQRVYQSDLIQIFRQVLP